RRQARRHDPAHRASVRLRGAMIDDVAKPRLRGVLHQYAAYVALVAGGVLVAFATSTRAMIACAVFAISHAIQLLVSALYHRVDWSVEKRALMRRADHAMIFVLIAGSATPF